MPRRKVVKLKLIEVDNVKETPVDTPLKITNKKKHVKISQLLISVIKKLQIKSVTAALQQPKKKRMKLESLQTLPMRSTSDLVQFAPAPTFYTTPYLFPEEAPSPASAMKTSTTETEAANGTSSPLTKEYDALMNWLKYGSREDPVPLPLSSTGDVAVCPSLSDVYELLDLDTNQTVTYTRTPRPALSPYIYQSQYSYHYYQYCQQIFPPRGYGPPCM